MKKNSPNSYITTVNVDGHDVEVEIVDNSHQNIREEFWCRVIVQRIDGDSCADYFLATPIDECQSLCAKAREAACKKWAEFIK